jgi:hypothetical protein
MRRYLLNKLYTAVLLVSILLLFSCGGNETNPDDLGACDKGYTNYIFTFNPQTFEQFTGTNSLVSDRVFYFYNGNRVQFFVANTLDNICTKEHLKIKFNYSMNVVPQPVPLKIFGEAYWLAYSRDVILVDNAIVSPGQEAFDQELEVGLSQGFSADEAGVVDVYLNVEFDTQGSFAADSTYLVHHLNNMYISGKHSDFQ